MISSLPQNLEGESESLAGELEDEDLWKDNADIQEKVR